MRLPAFFPRLALLAGLLAGAPAGAAPPAPVPGFEDSMAQRMLACTGCHGDQGRAAPDGYYPRIAGKPAGYLYNQLLNFRDGRRRYPLMTALLDPLSDAYLRDIARYFAELDVPYPPPAASAASPGQLERGRTLALRGDAGRDLPACVRCHGASMTGVAPAIPGLLGLPRDYLNAQLGAWRNGNRHAQAPDCMARVAQALTPDEIAAVAQWLSLQPVPGNGRPARSLPGPLPLDCGGVPPPAASGPAPR